MGATESFMRFLKGISSPCPDDDLNAKLAELGADWSHVLSFLASMYALRSRSTYRRCIVECVHNLWRREPTFRDLLEEHVGRNSLGQGESAGVCLPWLVDDEWAAVYQGEAAADVSALNQMEAASAATVQELAPLHASQGAFLGRAEKCFRCGEAQGYVFCRKGFGWRQRTHD